MAGLQRFAVWFLKYRSWLCIQSNEWRFCPAGSFAFPWPRCLWLYMLPLGLLKTALGQWSVEIVDGNWRLWTYREGCLQSHCRLHKTCAWDAGISGTTNLMLLETKSTIGCNRKKAWVAVGQCIWTRGHYQHDHGFHREYCVLICSSSKIAAAQYGAWMLVIRTNWGGAWSNPTNRHTIFSTFCQCLHQYCTVYCPMFLNSSTEVAHRTGGTVSYCVP